MFSILLLVLVALIVAGAPIWPHSAAWGWYPSGGIGALLVIVLILLVLGVL